MRLIIILLVISLFIVSGCDDIVRGMGYTIGREAVKGSIKYNQQNNVTGGVVGKMSILIEPGANQT